MGFLSRILQRPQPIETRSADYLPQHLGPFAATGWNDSGVSVNEQTALAASSVYAAVKILAEAVALLPVHVFQSEAGKKDHSHPVARLLAAEPNEFMTAATLRETLMLNLCLYGNAYAYIDRDEMGVPVGLYPLRSDCTRPFRENGNLYFQTRLGSTTATLTQDQVLHVLNFSFDGITGISPIQQARQNIGLSIALERFAAKLFSNGGNVGGVLKVPPMNKEAMNNFVSTWRENYTSLENAFKVAVLPDGFDFKQTTIDPERGQVKDARIHQVLEIARIFRIPPHMLGVLDKASYASIEMQSMEFYQQAVQPIVTRFEQEANRKLLLEREKRTHEIRFNLDAMLRASTKERLDAYAVAITNGVMTRAECRAKENLPFIEGSDVLLQPLNMTSVGQQPAIPASKPDDTAARSLIEDAARRVLTKESKALLRAAKKLNGPELRKWATTFYAEHANLVARVLTPPIKAAGLSIDPVEYARQHCDASIRSIESATDVHDVADEFLDIRPNDIATTLMEYHHAAAA